MLAIAATSLPAATQAATARWAWVVVRQSTGDSVPGPLDRGNSKGGAVFVTDLSGLFGPGVYGVGLDDVGPVPGEHGSVLVSTFGTLNRICTPDRWETTNDDVSIIVTCFTRKGVPAPATLVLD